MVAAKPLTDPQMRCLHAGFGEAGYTRRSDRDDRLAEAARLIGRDHLRSFSDLSAGEAGYLIGCLRRGEVSHRRDAAPWVRTQPPRRSPSPARLLRLGAVLELVVLLGVIAAMANQVRLHWSALAGIAAAAPLA